MILPSGNEILSTDLEKDFIWYDFTIIVKCYGYFIKIYTGRVETGKESYSDPAMGKVKI